MAPMKLHFLFMRYFSLFLFFEETLPTKLILNCVNILNLTNVIILFYILQLPLAFTNPFFLEKKKYFFLIKRGVRKVVLDLVWKKYLDVINQYVVKRKNIMLWFSLRNSPLYTI